jgi:hypothetical protein
MEQINKKWFLLIFPIVFIILYLRDKNREEKLSYTFTTFAIIEKISSGTARGAGFVSFKFKNKNNKLIFADHVGSISVCGINVEERDTVLIEYSLEDNSVAQIVKCYWNEELREKYVKLK